MVVPVSVWKSGYRQVSRWAYQQYADYFLRETHQVHDIQSHMSPEAMLAMVKPSLEQMIADSDSRHSQAAADLLKQI